MHIQVIHTNGYEKIIEATEPKSGLHAIFAIHRLQPNGAIGGLRIQPYASTHAALTDVLKLAKGMSYKAAFANIQYGGAKSVIILKPKQHKTHQLLTAYAHVLNQLNGDYLCGVDLGSTVDDINIIKQTSPYIAGLNQDNIRIDLSGFTAWGCFRGIEAIAQHVWGSTNLDNKIIAIQGLGSVGYKLAEFLFWAGAKLIVSDTNQALMKHMEDLFDAVPVSTLEILNTQCDILVPCAIGNVINENTITKLRCKAIGGAANNQLAHPQTGEQLKAQGILYAPDYVINAGGLICSAEKSSQGKHFSAKKARLKVNAIYDQLLDLFKMADILNQSTNLTADQIAEKKLNPFT